MSSKGKMTYTKLTYKISNGKRSLQWVKLLLLDLAREASVIKTACGSSEGTPERTANILMIPTSSKSNSTPGSKSSAKD